MQKKSDTKKRLISLDALRGLAALMVFIGHVFTNGSKNASTESIKTAEAMGILEPVHPVNMPDFFLNTHGGQGVMLFFYISGFVILMSAEKIKNAIDFPIRRIARLYPAYWLSILVNIIFLALFAGIVTSWKQIATNATMLQHFFNELGFGTDFAHITFPYWSLAAEMLFYGFIFVLIMFRKLEKIEVITFFYLLAGILYFYLPKDSVNNALQSMILGRLFPYFSLGIIAYKLYKSEISKWSIAIFIVANTSMILQRGLEEWVVSMLLYGLFILLLFNKLKIIGENKILIFFGFISYPFYLIHCPVTITLYNYIYDKTDFGFVVASIIAIPPTIIISYVIAKTIEPPFARKLRTLLDGLFNRPNTTQKPKPQIEN